MTNKELKDELFADLTSLESVYMSKELESKIDLGTVVAKKDDAKFQCVVVVNQREHTCDVSRVIFREGRLGKVHLSVPRECFQDVLCCFSITALKIAHGSSDKATEFKLGTTKLLSGFICDCDVKNQELVVVLDWKQDDPSTFIRQKHWNASL